MLRRLKIQCKHSNPNKDVKDQAFYLNTEVRSKLFRSRLLATLHVLARTLTSLSLLSDLVN